MIKRIRFGAPASADVPPELRPVRAVVCAVLPELTGDAPHDAVTIEWFADAAQCAEYAGDVVAEELVVRGADWLAQRWRDGGVQLKHMAFARRADGLSPAEFAQRWRAHAGRVGGTVIPEAARGLAYVQNHPLPRAVGEWPFDAVNEVYFDDLAALRARVEWFAANRTDDELFGESQLLAVREEVVQSTRR